MSETKMAYFKLQISGEEEARSVELAPDVTAELNDNREMIGIEILNANSFIRDFILEVAQAKMLNVSNK